MPSIRWRWLIFSFSEIFLSPPYALHSLTVASLHPTKKNSKCQKSFFAVSAFSLDTLHLLQVANFFFKKFSKSPYALHSLQVAMVLLTFGNFYKCRKNRFSQSLLFHSIPFSYVVDRIFPCTLLWEVFRRPLHFIFKIFLSPIYSIRCRWL